MANRSDRIYIFVDDAQVSDVLFGDITEVEHKIIVDLDFAFAGKCPLCEKELPEGDINEICCTNCGFEHGMSSEQMIDAYEKRYYE